MAKQLIKYDRRNDEFADYSALQKAAMFWHTSWSRRSYQDIVDLIRTHRPDVAHVHNYFPLLSPAAFWACHDERTPVVLTLHNYRMLCCNGIFHRDGQHCHECVEHGPWRGVRHACVNDSRAQSAAAAHDDSHAPARNAPGSEAVTLYIGLTEIGIEPFLKMGIPRERLAIKPHFIDPDPGTGTDQGYALYVGRLIENKGVRQLVEVWPRLGSLPLRIVGEGPLGGELRQLAATNGANIEFLGLQPPEQVLRQLQGARFLLVPSLHREGFPRVVTEALACGVPIVASNVEPLPTLIQHGQTGLIFEARNLDDLAAKLQEIQENDPAANCHARGGTARIRNQIQRQQQLPTADVDLRTGHGPQLT